MIIFFTDSSSVKNQSPKASKSAAKAEPKSKLLSFFSCLDSLVNHCEKSRSRLVMPSMALREYY